jgi:hypothetical protein
LSKNNELSQGRDVFRFNRQVGLHQSEYYLACVRSSAEIGNGNPLKPEAVAWANGIGRALSQGQAGMALAQEWCAGEKLAGCFFRVVADWWRRRTCGAVVVILGPVEEEKGDYRFVQGCGARS